MSTVLRLVGLDGKAESEDVRRFFVGLNSRVVIVGGPLREAFIVFTSERQGQLAMLHSGNLLKGSRVTLYESSMEELQNEMEARLQEKRKIDPQAVVESPPPYAPGRSPPPHAPGRSPPPHAPGRGPPPHAPGRGPPPHAPGRSPPPHAPGRSPPPHAPGRSPPPHAPGRGPPHTPEWSPLPVSPACPLPQTGAEPDNTHLFNSATQLMVGLVSVLQQLQSSQQRQENEVLPAVDCCSKAEAMCVSDSNLRTSEDSDVTPSYIRLFGLPAATVTKQDICHFFKGLRVQEVIIDVELGLRRGCLVKFATFQDGCDALSFNDQQWGSFCVEVRSASEKMWISALQECSQWSYEGADGTTGPQATQGLHRRIPSHERQRDSSKRLAQQQQRPRRGDVRRPIKHHSPSQKGKRPRSSAPTMNLSHAAEYCIMAKNLPETMTKTEIKELFRCQNISHDRILPLLDEERRKTDTVFVRFDKAEDYDYAMNLNGCHVASQAIDVSSITVEEMRAMLSRSNEHTFQREMDLRHKIKTKRRKKRRMAVDPAALTCLYVRNMPGDVLKTEIQDFFEMYELGKDKIFLLCDKDGNCMGEAVVQLKSAEMAALAQQELNGKIFKGPKILLTCINTKQMEALLSGY